MRVLAILAEKAKRDGRYKTMRSYFTRILQKDGSVLRNLKIRLPIYPQGNSIGDAATIQSYLLRSPRFTKSKYGFPFSIKKEVQGLLFLLTERDGTVLVRMLTQPQVKRKTKGLFTTRLSPTTQTPILPPNRNLQTRDLLAGQFPIPNLLTPVELEKDVQKASKTLRSRPCPPFGHLLRRLFACTKGGWPPRGGTSRPQEKGKGKALLAVDLEEGGVGFDTCKTFIPLQVISREGIRTKTIGKKSIDLL